MARVIYLFTDTQRYQEVVQWSHLIFTLRPPPVTLNKQGGCIDLNKCTHVFEVLELILKQSMLGKRDVLQ